MERILVGYDGSRAARCALDRACELVPAFGASLTVLTGAADRLPGSGQTADTDEERAQHLAAEGAELARGAGVTRVETIVSNEAPDDALAIAAAGGFDLVVVGHRGLGALEEFLLGSTAKSIVDRVPCSVLVVKGGRDE